MIGSLSSSTPAMRRTFERGSRCISTVTGRSWQHLVLQHHQVEAAEVRAQQHAALARLQRFARPSASPSTVTSKRSELAARHVDAVEQGGGEAVEMCAKTSRPARPATHVRRREELARGAPRGAVGRRGNRGRSGRAGHGTVVRPDGARRARRSIRMSPALPRSALAFQEAHRGVTVCLGPVRRPRRGDVTIPATRSHEAAAGSVPWLR